MTITAMIIVKTMRRKKKKKNRHPEGEKKTWNSFGHFDSFDSC